MKRANDTIADGMPVIDALQVLIDLRPRDQIVVTNQGSARIWPNLSRSALDLHYNPSTMGGAIPLALGLALAQPQREVLVVSGDGALLMNLGSLVTVAGAGVKNLTMVVLENRLYEVTGGQQTPAATLVDFAAIARAAGFSSAAAFDDLTAWRGGAAQAVASPGPRLISLRVQRSPEEYSRFRTPPIGEQIAALQAALHGFGGAAPGLAAR